jgi:hypothetical protein
MVALFCDYTGQSLCLLVLKLHKTMQGRSEIESSWNVMAHGDAREEKCRRNWRIEWVASTLHTTSEHDVSSITTANAHTSAAISRLNWPPADLNGLVRFAERRNLVSARVPSHFKRSLQLKSEVKQQVMLSVVRNINYVPWVRVTVK